MTQLVSPSDQNKDEIVERRNSRIPDLYKGRTSDDLTRFISSFKANAYGEAINGKNRARTTLYQEIISRAQPHLDKLKGRFDKPELESPMDPHWNFVESMKNAFSEQFTSMPDPVGAADELAEELHLDTRLAREAGHIPYTKIEVGLNNEDIRDDFFKKIQYLAEQTGDEELDITREEFDNMVNKKIGTALEEQQEVLARSDAGTLQGFSLDMGGALPALMSNPWDIGTLGISAPAGARLFGQRALAQVAFDAGAETLVEIGQLPAAQKTRREAGGEFTEGQMVANMSAAPVGATVFSGGGQLARYSGIKINKAIADRKQAYEIGRELVSRGVAVTDEKVADQILSMDNYLRRTNPNSVATYSKKSVGLGQHITNMKNAQDALLKEKEFESSGGELNQMPVINRGTKKVSMDNIDVNRRATDLEEPENADRVLLWEDGEGRLNIIEGEEKIKEGVEIDVSEGRANISEAKAEGASEIDATVLRKADGIDAKMAKEYALSRRFEQGKISREEFARAIGKDPDDFFHPKKSEFTEQAISIRDKLEDEALLAFLDSDDMSFNVSSVVAEEVAPVKQAAALRATRIANTKSEARAIIEEGIEEGFEDINPSEILGRRNEVMEESIQKLKSGDVELRTPDGEKVEIDNGTIGQIRKLGRGENILAEPLNRAISPEGKSGEAGARQSDSGQFLSAIQREIDDGNIGRDALRPTEGAEGFRGEGRKALNESNFDRGYEPGSVEDQIVNGDLPEIETLRQQFEDIDDEIPIGSLDEDGELTTAREAMERIEDDKKTLEELKECMG